MYGSRSDHIKIVIDVKKSYIIYFTILLQILFIVLVCLDWVGLKALSIFRQVIGFIYVTFIPGILLLGIFKLMDCLSTIEILLYSVGLSLFVVILIGILINTLLPVIGFMNPISENIVITVFMLVVPILSIIFKKTKLNVLHRIILPIELLIFLLLFLILLIFSIMGTLLLYFSNENNIILIVFLVISIIPILVGIINGRYVLLKNMYPFLIWICALSLIFYNSIFGSYIRPTDNLVELYFLKTILKNKVWNVDVPNNINSMAGVVLVLSIYRLIMGCSSLILYKLFIPILSSLIPVGLYVAYEKKLENKLNAFYASFFFISLFVYFTWASITMKMVSSGIFITLLIILIYSNLNRKSKYFLSIIFLFSLTVSHYGTSYIFLFSLIIALILGNLFLYLHESLHSLYKYLYLDLNFVLLNFVFVFGWYIYTSSGTNFDSIVLIGKSFLSNICKVFYASSNSYGIQALFGKFPVYLEIMKYLYIFSYIFILIGLYVELRDHVVSGIIVDEYTLLSIPLAVFIVLPYVSRVSQYAGGRMWLISSYFLSPFLVKGFLFVNGIAKYYLNILNVNKILSIELFLCIFMLFNTGFVAEVVYHNNISASVYISKARIYSAGSLYEKEYLDRVYLSINDVLCAKWLKVYMFKKTSIFCGKNAEQNLIFTGLTLGHITKKINEPVVYYLTNNKNKLKHISSGSYIYLTKFNTFTRKIKYGGGTPSAGIFPKLFNLTDIYYYMSERCNKIYTNNGSNIYYVN